MDIYDLFRKQFLVIGEMKAQGKSPHKEFDSLLALANRYERENIIFLIFQAALLSDIDKDSRKLSVLYAEICDWCWKYYSKEVA